MEHTALDLVNEVLSAGDSDPVTTIGETEESQQVLKIVNRAYRKITEELDWKYRGVLTRLDTATGTTTTWSEITYPALPWVMKLPSRVESVREVYYNDKRMKFVDPAEFKHYHIHQLGLKTDSDPTYYTTFDEQYLVFDAFSSDDENQLSSANSSIRVTKFPADLDLTNDGDQPDCPDRFYLALINKAIQWYYLEIAKNISLAREYQREYIESRSQLKAWARRVRPQIPFYSKVDFSRRTSTLRGADSESTDVEVV